MEGRGVHFVPFYVVNAKILGKLLFLFHCFYTFHLVERKMMIIPQTVSAVFEVLWICQTVSIKSYFWVTNPTWFRESSLFA